MIIVRDKIIFCVSLQSLLINTNFLKEHLQL